MRRVLAMGKWSKEQKRWLVVAFPRDASIEAAGKGKTPPRRPKRFS